MATHHAIGSMRIHEMVSILTSPGSGRRWKFRGAALLVLSLTYILLSSFLPAVSLHDMVSGVRLSRSTGLSTHADNEQSFSLSPHDGHQTAVIAPQNAGFQSSLYDETEAFQPDGTKRFDRRRRATAALTLVNEAGEDVADSSIPDTLFLVLTKNSESWSRDNATAPPRTVEDMLQILTATQLDLTTVSLALTTTTLKEYSNIISATSEYPLARITVILSEPDKDLSSIASQDRHTGSLQHLRRASLARLRNYLMLSTLENEQHIFWLDADVIRFSEKIVQTMISHSQSNETAGIITTVCRKTNSGNYDQNAYLTVNPDWVEHAVQPEKFDEATSAYVSTRKGVDALIQNTSNNELVGLTSVGGTLLYIRASLVRYGLVFPWWNVVGTTWRTDGWVGQETEGLCWMAKSLEGGGCYVLGGSHHTFHAD